MKVKLLLLIIVFSSISLVGSAESNTNPAFPEVGKSYSIDFCSSAHISLIGSQAVQYDNPARPSWVEVLARGEGQWCLVDALFFFRTDPETKKPVYRKERFWLNFGGLITARERRPAKPGDFILLPQ